MVNIELVSIRKGILTPWSENSVFGILVGNGTYSFRPGAYESEKYLSKILKQARSCTCSWNVRLESKRSIETLAFVVDRNNVRADFARNSRKKKTKKTKKKKKKKKNHYVEDGESLEFERRLPRCLNRYGVSDFSRSSTIAKAAFNRAELNP